MTIVIRYRSNVLGEGVFWRGHAACLGTIRNVIARRLAALVAEDGRRRAEGMWSAEAEGSATESGRGLTENER